MQKFSVLVGVLCGVLSSCNGASSALPSLPHSSSRVIPSSPSSCAATPKNIGVVPRGGSAGVLASYNSFSKTRPFENGVIISLIKTALADVLAQSVTAGPHDWARTAMFGLFGAFYLGMFQYLYQVLVFKKLFKSTERFTSESWAEKAKDVEGLVSLFFQICLDMCVLVGAYLPAFYIFKASAFSPDCNSPTSCVSNGYGSYLDGFAADVPTLLMCWIPADLLCFSIPLHLRLPVRHVWSFVWHVYMSHARGASH